jgi:hypothetical protein
MRGQVDLANLLADPVDKRRPPIRSPSDRRVESRAELVGEVVELLRELAIAGLRARPEKSGARDLVERGTP